MEREKRPGNLDYKRPGAMSQSQSVDLPDLGSNKYLFKYFNYVSLNI